MNDVLLPIALSRRRVRWSSGCGAVSVALLVSGLCGCGDGSTQADRPAPGATSRTTGQAQPAPAQQTVAASRSTARAACRSMQPAEVIKRFLPAARRRAASAPLDRRFLKTAADAPKSLRESPAYRGVAARVYALSLPPAERQAALMACATQLINKGTSK